MITIRGLLTIENADSFGCSTLRRQVHNLVTDEGLKAIAALFAGGFGLPSVGGNSYDEDDVCQGGQSPPTGCFVNEMQIGATVAPAAPTPSDSALAGPAAYSGKSSDVTMSVAYPSTGVVRFQVSIPSGTLDGTTFTEVGMFSADGTLISRLVIAGGWLKPVGQSTTFTYDMEFGRS